MIALELGGAFLMGLMGSVHCVAMCGPIAAVLCAGPGRDRASAGLVPHAGRLATYAGLGIVAGLIGGAIHGLLPLEALQLGARIAAAALLIVVGLYTAGFLRQLSAVERLTAPLFARVARHFGPSTTLRARFVHGVLWGLVPCGLVYGALGLAVLGGSAERGALVMLAFGAGTLPAMIAVGVFSRGFRRVVRDRRVHQAAGMLLAVAGTVHLALAFRWSQRVLLVPDGTQLPASGSDPAAAPPAAQPRACH